MFLVYVIVQLFINWLLTTYIMSPFQPSPGQINTLSPVGNNTTINSVHPDSSKASTANYNYNTERGIANEHLTLTSKWQGEVLSDYNHTENGNNIINDSIIHRQNPNDVTDVTEEVVEPRTGLSHRVLVVTSISGNTPKRESVPYWSWVECLTCKKPRPPRCHHCHLCNQCVLKRDHHCYFTRNCVGMYNQRYFINFLLWGVVMTTVSCAQLIPFLFVHVLPRYSYWDLVTPYNVYRVLKGDLPFLYLHLIWVVWGVVFLTCFACGMFGTSVYQLFKGVTHFESTAKIKLVDNRSTAERMRATLGRNWAVNVFIPGASASRLIMDMLPASIRPSSPLEDPVRWPSIKP